MQHFATFRKRHLTNFTYSERENSKQKYIFFRHIFYFYQFTEKMCFSFLCNLPRSLGSSVNGPFFPYIPNPFMLPGPQFSKLPMWGSLIIPSLIGGIRCTPEPEKRSLAPLTDDLETLLLNGGFISFMFAPVNKKFL